MVFLWLTIDRSQTRMKISKLDNADHFSFSNNGQPRLNAVYSHDDNDDDVWNVDERIDDDARRGVYSLVEMDDHDGSQEFQHLKSLKMPSTQPSEHSLSFF